MLKKMFFASPFWTKLQNIFGHCCMSKLDKVAKHWLALGRPANQPCRHYEIFTTRDMEMVVLYPYPHVHVP